MVSHLLGTFTELVSARCFIDCPKPGWATDKAHWSVRFIDLELYGRAVEKFVACRTPFIKEDNYERP